MLSSLDYFGARYYDPSLGRWTQQDPVAGSLGDLDSADRYVYANDNPVNMVDPSGRIAVVIVLGIVACIGGALGSEASLVYSNGPGNPPSANTTIKTLIAGCIAGAIVGLASVYGFAEGAVALTTGTLVNAGFLSIVSGAVFGMLLFLPIDLKNGSATKESSFSTRKT